MALPDSCFVETGGRECNCTEPPPKLPDRPTFFPCQTTTTEPPPTTTFTTQTTGTTTIITDPTGPTSEPSTTNTDGTTFSTEGATDMYVPPCTSDPCNQTTTANVGVIVGCTCGAIIIIVICVFLVWYLWKKRICCFKPIGIVKSDSQESLPGNEEKEVELLNIKKGTVVLNPICNPSPPPPTAWPEPTGPPPKRLEPINTTDTALTPVETSKGQETSPSGTSEGRADSSKSNKSKKSGKRSNRVSPEPGPSPRPATRESEA